VSNITCGEGTGCDVNFLVDMGARTFRVYLKSARAALLSGRSEEDNSLMQAVVDQVTVDGAFMLLCFGFTLVQF
jgi:hypothetical protein